MSLVERENRLTAIGEEREVNALESSQEAGATELGHHPEVRA